MVATTTQVADLVRQVGGARISVDGMLRPGGDPHDYEPRPSDVAAVARADLVFRSGGEVDGWLGDVIDDAGGNAQVVSLIDSVDRIGDDPHWWQDPRNAERAVETIRARLTKLDPAGRRAYRRNAARLERRLRSLDARIAGCVARVPAAKRRIVTTHDALGYFARRYGVDVVGAVIPSLSTQAQASAGDVQKLVDQIRREHVEAVFPESSVNPDIERAIAREAGASVGGKLYADSLGPKGSAGETYVGALSADAAALVHGMSGGRVSCRLTAAAALAGAAGGALAPQRHVVALDRVVDPAREPLDGSLEVGVLERGDLAAGVADDVVVMLAVRVDRLVPRDSLGGVDPSRQAQLVEQLERPVHACEADVLAPAVQAVRDLLGGHAAAEIGERLDHGRPWTAQAIALPLELTLSVLSPVGHLFSIGSRACAKPCTT